MQDSVHFNTMLHERGIRRDWADRAIEQPDQFEDRDDGTRHYLKQVPEFENRWLRVIVNIAADPPKRVTAFFDRRLRRTPCE